MGTAEFKTIGNVKQFLELQTRHATELVQSGVVFTDPIPAALKPLVRALGPWPGADDWAWNFMNPDDEGRAVGPEEKARIGGFDTFQVVAKPPIEVAGHSQRISGRNDFRHGGMSMQIAREKITRPTREWNKAIAREAFNVFTSGGFKGSSAARTEGYTFTVKNFRGNDVSVQAVTESATRASATVAHSGQLVTWGDKQGSTMAAGHDHVPANAGGDWTEALGRTARDHLLEHPGVNAVDAYVGATVAEDVFTQLGTEAANTDRSWMLAQSGLPGEDEFGIPTPIGTHDGVRYYRLDAFPDTLGVYFARGRKPLGLTVGIQRADGNEMPGAWNDAHLMDPETQAVNYGYRGPAAVHVVEPTSIYVANYAA